ncbi:hypothetical protein F0L74_22305 [Chitinophaga agrisoli]|uniref:Uncharacterized protein n=1 Tax=Chitinophaga agrisoli TaxID=2607653 RepID=A0A5B2VK35_9BACT|nr:hypothetical protein F0L74_22305 [Chitinophaga agrisoli]
MSVLAAAAVGIAVVPLSPEELVPVLPLEPEPLEVSVDPFFFLPILSMDLSTASFTFWFTLFLIRSNNWAFAEPVNIHARPITNTFFIKIWI